MKKKIPLLTLIGESALALGLLLYIIYDIFYVTQNWTDISNGFNLSAVIETSLILLSLVFFVLHFIFHRNSLWLITAAISVFLYPTGQVLLNTIMDPLFLFRPPFFYTKAWFVFWLLELAYQIVSYLLTSEKQKVGNF